MHVHMRCATTSRLPAARRASSYVAALAASVWTVTHPRCRLFHSSNCFHRLYRHAECNAQSIPQKRTPRQKTYAVVTTKCASNNVCIQCMLRTRLHCVRLRRFRLLRLLRFLHRHAHVLLHRCWSWLCWRPFPRIFFFGSLSKLRSKDTMQYMCSRP
jgi:hypothetical protein